MPKQPTDEERRWRKALEMSVLALLDGRHAKHAQEILDELRSPGCAPLLSRQQLYALGREEATATCLRLERRGLAKAGYSAPTGWRGWTKTADPTWELLGFQLRACDLLCALPEQGAIDIEPLRTRWKAKLATKRAKEILLEHGLAQKGEGSKWSLTERGRAMRARCLEHRGEGIRARSGDAPEGAPTVESVPEEELS